MFHAIKAEFSIAVRKKGFQITFLGMLAYVTIVTLYYIREQTGYDVSQLYHPAVLSGLNTYCEFSSTLYALFPFIIIFPGGFLIFNDRKTQINMYILSREGKMRYYIAKITVCSSTTFLAVTLPFLMELLINVLIFPQDGGRALSGWSIFADQTLLDISRNLFGSLYIDHIYLYCILSIAVFGIFSGCAAVFTMGISTFKINYRVILLLPVSLVNWLCNMMGNLFSSVQFETSWYAYLFFFGSYPDSNYLYFLLLALILLMTGILLVCINGILRKDEV